jgi:SAM-dependent methyltransferase
MSLRDSPRYRPRPPKRPSEKRVPPVSAPAGSERFRHTDRYRAEREWVRYAGTAQRDLWRELRERFLVRQATATRWVLDLGSGPGRFTSFLGTAPSQRVALDISLEMLRLMKEHWNQSTGQTPVPGRVRADALFPPFLVGTFEEVAVLGNTLGFAGSSADRLLESASSLVAPGGTFLVEVAPGPGERSRYLTRLPPTSLARLLRSPVRAILPRIDREGFDRIPYRREEQGQFRRIAVEELSRWFAQRRWELREVLAVAPALGPMASRVEAIRADAKAWEHLLLVEEELGRRPERWADAAAVLFAARRAASPGHPG